MKIKFALMKAVMAVLLWCVAVFFMALAIFLIIRIFAFYFIGGDFLFSYKDVVMAFKISLLCGPLCGLGSWWIYYQHYRQSRNR